MYNFGLQHHVVPSPSLLTAGGRWETESTESMGGWSWQDYQDITPCAIYIKELLGAQEVWK